MKKFLFVLLLLVSAFANAACPQFYPLGKQLTVPNTKELCNSFYVIVYDDEHNHPVFVSELLKHGSGVGTIPRIGSFHTDPRVSHTPTNEIYTGTGFDKGHLAPADDGATIDQVKDTFLLTNMTPQQPTVNRISWKALEMKVRKIYDNSSSDVYVVNIPIYGKQYTFLNNSFVPVPTGYWKIVYHDNVVEYFYAANTLNAPVTPYSAFDWFKSVSQ